MGREGKERGRWKDHSANRKRTHEETGAKDKRDSRDWLFLPNSQRQGPWPIHCAPLAPCTRLTQSGH